MLTGAAESNRALALLRAGRPADSVASARQALARDADNPIFIEAYASALRETGDTAAAITAYQGALAVDPTLYTAQNNLGVLLARTGRLREAEDAFRRSIGTNPSYALGWANLGSVLNARLPLPAFLEAQGAWLRAAHLDPTSVVRVRIRRWTRRCTRAISTSPGPFRRTGSSRPRPGRR